MEKILKALDDFVLEMIDKGYNNTFQTNGAHQGNLKESMMKYLEQTVLERGNGLKDGICLFTYLRWEGEEQDHISAWMLLEQSFTISKMNLTLGNSYGKIRSLDLDLKGKPIPTKAEAIASITTSKQNIKHKKGYKI